MKLIRPAVLPDEYALGYKGRLMRINGIVDPKQVVDWMRKMPGATKDVQQASVVELLAAVAAMPPSEFVRHHTTLPFQRGFAYRPAYLGLPHGSPENRALLRSTALRPIRPGCYFCSQCVQEDVAFHGTSYWRREHQLPGFFWCRKHRSSLRYVERDGAFLRSPAEFVDACNVINDSWVAGLLGRGPINRYMNIATELSVEAMPMDERDVSRVVRQRAIAQGLHVGRGRAHRPPIADRIRESFDAAWLASVLPEISETPPTTARLDIMSRATSGKRLCVSTTTYVALLATLFESADDALRALTSSHRPAPNQLCRAPTPQHDKRAYAAYVSARGNLRDVAKHLGTTGAWMQRRLRDQGLPGLGSAAGRALTRAATAFLVEGQSMPAAIQSAGVSVAAFEALLRQAAAPLQKALIAMHKGGARKPIASKSRPAAPPTKRTSGQNQASIAQAETQRGVLGIAESSGLAQMVSRTAPIVSESLI